jgi:DNA invertase Pin-like site-specific DNA recombinase
MKQYFAYTRVSTVKQGEHGVSLQEQKSEIERYALQKGLAISEWFEERETAAKIGRKLFTQLMQRLRKGEAAGVIIHKIDRSARNLRDWVDIGQLTDDGIEVHFTREALDMQSSSGRLSADVQAVVAANYIRNLREETIKGFYGRLKQGLYPLPAPLGYLDAGGGKPKTADPIRGPRVKTAFELYASQEFSQYSLALEMERRGLRTKSGLPVSKNTLAGILSNPFYFGLLRIRKGDKSFAGAHQPLITRKLFDTVQDVLHGRAVRSKPSKREFIYSRLIRCQACGRSLIAEMQKAHVYYRCHSGSCNGTSLREEKIDAALLKLFGRLRLHPEELKDLDLYWKERQASATQGHQRMIAEFEIRLAAVNERLNRLMDALLDGHIDPDLFGQRKTALLSERLDYENQIRELRADPNTLLKRVEEFVELAKTACLLFENGNRQEKRQMLQLAMSNRSALGKTLDFALKPALSAIAARRSDRRGGPSSRRSRTFWERWTTLVESDDSQPHY